MISHKLFLPPGDTHPIGNIDDLILVGNHMGSTVWREDMTLGDAGRKAEALMRRTGHPVMAYDRPGTDPDAEEVSVRPDNEYEVARRLGDELLKIVEAEGFKSVILAGNSAAASTAITLAKTETLPVTRLSVMDPVGLMDVSFGQGLSRWIRHSIREPGLEKPHRTDDDRIEDATGLSIQGFFRDSRAYHKVWESRVAANDLCYVARRLGQVATLVTWPEHTFTADSERINDLGSLLPAMRRDSDTGNQRFDTTILAGASHAWFENFRVYADCVARVIDPDFAGYDY